MGTEQVARRALEKKPPPQDFETITQYPPPEPTRRTVLLSWAGIAWSAFAGAGGAGGFLLQRFLFPNVTFEPKQSFAAGFPEDYAVGQVDTRWTDKYQVWIVREEWGFYALLAVCTHLGCPPSWLPAEGKFKCPCHGSGFRKDGVNFEGPAPRPLERVFIGRADDGQILIDKNQKFQQEKGQWGRPGSELRI